MPLRKREKSSEGIFRELARGMFAVLKLSLKDRADFANDPRGMLKNVPF